MRRMAKVFKFASAAAVVASALLSPGATAAPPPATNEDSVAARAKALVAQMTPEEKAAQLTTEFVIPMPGQPLNADKRAADGAGSFLFVFKPSETNRLQRIALERSRLKIPLLFGFDVVHGWRTIFPVPIALAASWDPPLVERSQAVAAAEARAAGINWTFAPMVDIARDPRWGRMVEGAGEDPYLASAMAAAQVRGFQGATIGAPNRLIAGPKHFAGYGASLGGRDYDQADIADADLWNVYLPPFKAALDAGAGNIMSAYMPLNGVPATGNHWLLTEVLRDRWHFRGWVVSDSQAVKALETHGFAKDRQAAATAALNAGLDMEMFTAQSAFDTLPAALAAGEISQARLDESVQRVLEMKIRMGLFDRPYVDERAYERATNDPRHLEASRVAAERAAVLLRNEANVLPLDGEKVSSLAVIGALGDSARDAAGSWVFAPNDPHMQSLLEGLRSALGSRVKITYAPGVSLPSRINPSPTFNLDRNFKRPAPADDDTGIDEAVRAARAADVAVVVVGEGQDMSGEMASRSTLSLPGRQKELLNAIAATGKPVVAVLMNGRPLDIADTKANAILDIWYPGSQGGKALANLLFGKVSPGGKLPFAWPRNVGQVPNYYAQLTSHDPKRSTTRYWNDASNAPAYPFGYGLSYSNFAFSNLRTDVAKIGVGGSVTVMVDLKNTGARTADEVAQLYIHQRYGSAARPVRELKGFQRVTLKPGESRSLRFTLTAKELSYWSAATRDWMQDKTVFDVAVGSDATAPFGTSFEVGD